ncbi:MAG: hypothetical protein WAU69_04725, partial [Solirubrobacteraceae bacterium]
MSDEQQTEAVHDATAGSGDERARNALPPISIPEGWPGKPGVRLRIHLIDPAPEPVDSIERLYAAGLAALSRDETLAALEHFRSVIAQDLDGIYSTSRLLALVLSAEVGDVVSLRALLGPCMTNAQPDAFAQHAIDSTGLDFYYAADHDRADIFVGECIDQPAITSQIALAGYLLATNQTADAVRALDEDGIPAWEARHAAWASRARTIIE